MGLDVEFYLRGAEEPVHYRRNHWELQDLFFVQHPEPAYEAARSSGFSANGTII
jgi:hypothetical protein